MIKVEHIGIAVKDLATSIPLYERLLNTLCYKRESVAGEGVETAFFRQGETKIELLEDQKPDGVINRFIERKGEGIHHIAFQTEDIRSEMERLTAAGFRVLDSEPRVGADNKWVCFLHPKETGGVLIELCQDRMGLDEV
jgi:methylmalonyl-CoA/ethylmalonyl-CoA epimerase